MKEEKEEILLETALALAQHKENKEDERKRERTKK